MVTQHTLYREVTSIAEDYFGPAAPRFINRIIESHLRKDPTEVTKKDLPALITWVRLTVSLMTDDQHTVTEFVARLNRLTKSPTHQ